MSGQQWGSVVGGIIGAYFGNPQLGATIGGYIGGAIDPTQIQGPRLTDAKTQTATDGAFRTYGDGTFPTTGNIIWVDPIVKEHETTDDGKGSGQEVTTYTYTISSAVAVSKGPITGYKLVKRNKKVVFDARTDAELTALGYSSQQIAETRAAQAKFLEKCTFYYGVAEQTPDPTMVAVKGVGNVPGYSGTAYIVMTDDDTIEGEVAQFEFVVANCGERTEDFTGAPTLLITGSAKTVGGPVFAVADASASPEFVGVPQSSGADIELMTATFHDGTWVAIHKDGVRYAHGLPDTWLSGTIDAYPSGASSFGQVVGGAGGFVSLIQSDGNSPTAYLGTGSPLDFKRTTLFSVMANGSVGQASSSAYIIPADEGYILSGKNKSYYFSETIYGQYVAQWDATKETASGRNVNAECIVYWYDIRECAGEWYAVILWDARTALQRRQLIKNANGRDQWASFDVVLDDDFDESSSSRPAQLCEGGGYLVCYNTDGTLWTSANNWAEPIATGLAGPGASAWYIGVNGGRRIIYADELFYLIGSSDKLVTFDPQTLEVSDLITLPISNTFSLSVGNMGSAGWQAIPDAPGFYINPTTGEIIGPDGIQISVCKPSLGEIVSRQCAKRISTSVIDVSELTDLVVGFRVASPSSPQKNITATMPGYMFDSSEFDGILHFPKRGGADSFSLNFDDLCERDDGDAIQWERTQEPELLRKLTVGYMDPDTTYTATTQQWERRSGTVAAEGEGTIELPIVGTKDWAAQAAHMNGKVAWGEADKGTLHTSIAKAALVTAAVGTIVDQNGTAHRVRIEKIDDEGLKRMVEFRRTRADLYQSTATGASKPLPLFPGSNIRGPADGLLMNLPVLVDANDVPGIYWAAAGFMSGWIGATLQFLRAGQWVDAGTVTAPAAVGTLLDPLPAHAGDIDTVNTLHLRMNQALESVSWLNLLQERNAMAILYPDGTGEIIQPQTVVEVAPFEFECTTLLRGRLATTPGDHATGARVVFLDSRVQYATLQPTDLVTTLTYRFVSLGTDPDAAEVQTIELDTMQSQTEWPVAGLSVEQAGDDFTLTWLARDRLGTDVFPIRSTNWRGYEVSWSYGGDTHTETVLTETVTFNLPGASDITFSVAQLNLYTGAGPAQTVTIP